MLLRYYLSASLGLVVAIGIVFCMDRFQGLPFAEYTEDIVESWSSQLQAGRFNPSSFDRADIDLVMGYLKNKPSLTVGEQALIASLNQELIERAAREDVKNRIEGIKLLEQELVGLATQEGDLPLDVGYLNSILSSIATYRLATRNPDSFAGLHDLVVATLGSLGAQNKEAVQDKIFLVPIDALNQLGLCPLFPRFEDLVVEGKAYQSQLPVFFTRIVTGVKTDWQLTELGNKDQQAASTPLAQLPCWLDVSTDVAAKDQQIKIVQLKAVNQDSLPETVGACPTLALRSSLKVFDYATSGDVSHLVDLYDQKDAAEFISSYGCIKWANIKEVEAFFANKIVSSVKNNMGFLPSLLLFNPDYARNVDPGMVQYVAQLTQKIKSGLNQPQFFFTLIVGNEEKAQFGKGFGHYYSLSIIKKDKETQYVLVDTQATRYYLYSARSEQLISKELQLYQTVNQPSYELKLLLYVIEMLHKGASNQINLRRDTPLQF